MVNMVNQEAFARPISSVGNGIQYPAQRGMTKREYLAAHEVIPWGVVIDGLVEIGETTPTIDRVLEYRAVMRYRSADAMILAMDL